MKYLRLMTWVLAPLTMIVLGYLFLLPPETALPIPAGLIGLVILDPVAPDAIDRMQVSAPVLARLKRDSLHGVIAPNGAVTMDDAIREILTGKNARKLRQPVQVFDRETYVFSLKSPWIVNEGDLFHALKKHHYHAVRLTSDETGNRNTHPTPDAVRAQMAGVSADNGAVAVYLPRGDLPESDYIQAVDACLAEMVSAIDTWLVICPMHDMAVARHFHINQWLLQKGYLNLTPAGDIDMASSRVFHAGGSEPGLRINRHLTYASGIVPRDEYGKLRKDLVADLRTIALPPPEKAEKVETIYKALETIQSDEAGEVDEVIEADETGETGEVVDADETDNMNEAAIMLFSRLYRGEEVYTYRGEGNYPDIVWEIVDPAVDIRAELLPDPMADPWRKAAAPDRALHPGGWLWLSGPPFNRGVQDLARLDGLMGADIAPTVLFLLSCPVARDMQGRVLQPLMVENLQLQVPIWIDSYIFHDPLVEQEF